MSDTAKPSKDAFLELVDTIIDAFGGCHACVFECPDCDATISARGLRCTEQEGHEGPHSFKVPCSGRIHTWQEH